jgi:S1-C subfamily serine protease
VTTLRGSVRGGNSGGPAVDARGRVLTTVFARRPGGDGGFGVPSELVRAALGEVGSKVIRTECVDR